MRTVLERIAQPASQWAKPTPSPPEQAGSPIDEPIHIERAGKERPGERSGKKGFGLHYKNGPQSTLTSLVWREQ